MFVFTDDQRFDTIAALGNSEIDTPNMDRLVHSGTTFTHAHIMGGTAQAVCMPSRAMMMTGRTLFSLEGEGQRIPKEHVTMFEWFRSHGYATCHVGKWHQDRASHHRSFDTGSRIFGFEKPGTWYASNAHWHTPVHDFDPTGCYRPEDTYMDPPIEPFTQPFETTKEHGKHSAEFFTDGAIEFVENHVNSDDQRPFFLYLAHLAPHDPRQYPRRLIDRYRESNVSLPPNFAVQHPFDNGDLFVRDELLEAHPRRPERVRQHLADYYAIITHLDEQLGRLLDQLDTLGVTENTIIIFAGDNGLAVGQHGLMGKQNLYDHSLRVPLIMTGAGVPVNQRTSSLCYLLDIFPTLCDLTGLDTPCSVEGKSLLPVLQDPAVSVRDILHFAYCGVQRAVRRDSWKLIEYVIGRTRTSQLFDLSTDPHEINNIAGDTRNTVILRELREELEQWPITLGDCREYHGKPFWSGYRTLPASSI
ncbi:MAG: sulfatase-like hydrolase/transferase [Bacteroidetes bacterium]|nr:sulfatase-like hydrolase/transferase [Bacteroidota bacterium]